MANRYTQLERKFYIVKYKFPTFEGLIDEEILNRILLIDVPGEDDKKSELFYEENFSIELVLEKTN